MTDDEKIKLIIENADGCNYRLADVVKRVINPELTLSDGMADWLRSIGVDDPRIAPTLDDTLSPDARRAMLNSLLGRYKLSCPVAALMMKISPATVSSYKFGRLNIPIKRLMQLQRIVDAIDAAAADPTDK